MREYLVMLALSAALAASAANACESAGPATAIDAVRLGAVHYLSKPADADDVLTAFARGDAPPLSTGPADYSTPSLARAEWEHINRVLTDCQGNVSQAARLLGLHRRSLQRKLSKYPVLR